MILDGDVSLHLSYTPARSIGDLAEMFDCDKTEMAAIVHRLIKGGLALWHHGELKNAAKCEHDGTIKRAPNLRLIVCR